MAVAMFGTSERELSEAWKAEWPLKASGHQTMRLAALRYILIGRKMNYACTMASSLIDALMKNEKRSRNKIYQLVFNLRTVCVPC